MMKKAVVLWCHPRSVSTAFERAFLQREEFYCLHEPFGDAYYFGPQRQSLRYDTAHLPRDSQLTSTTFQFVCDEILTTRPGKRTFVKDMACHVYSYLKDHELPIDQTLSTFLIRNPIKAVPSMYECSISGWGSFDPNEMGYLKQRKLFDHVTDRYRQTPVVVNSEDLVKNPTAILRKYCDLVDIEFQECMIEWKPKRIEQFDKWTGWHDKAQRSTGFSYDLQTLNKDLSTYPQIVYKTIEENLPTYDYLNQYIISAIGIIGSMISFNVTFSRQ